MDQHLISMVSACTALVASMVSPIVTLTVAKQQFNANVISTNRQKWIDTFRDHMAEFISVLSSAAMDGKIIKSQSAVVQMPRHDHSHLLKSVERATRSFAQISLMTKDDDAEHLKLVAQARLTLETLLKEGPSSEKLMAYIDDVTQMGRQIIRREWGRVKRGI